MEIWQSSDRNNFAQFFLRHGEYICMGYLQCILNNLTEMLNMAI